MGHNLTYKCNDIDLTSTSQLTVCSLLRNYDTCDINYVPRVSVNNTMYKPYRGILKRFTHRNVFVRRSTSCDVTTLMHMSQALSSADGKTTNRITANGRLTWRGGGAVSHKTPLVGETI